MLPAAALNRSVANEKWYLVHSLPRAERTAEYQLRAQGFSTFLPRISKTVRHARRLKTVLTPLFPRYLFVALDLERDRWLAVRSTIGVSRLIAHRDGRPVAVPPGVVESLLARSDGQVTRLDADFVKGQRIRVLSGPFADFGGTLERMDDSGRVQVLLDLMATAVPVSLHRSALAPAA